MKRSQLAIGLLLFLLLQTMIVHIAICQDITSFTTYTQNIPGSKLSFKMMPIPAGKFIMGMNGNTKNQNEDEGPSKEVELSAFWMGAHEVTRDELDVFLKDEATSQNVNVDAITRPSPQYVDLTWGMGKEGGFPANSMSQRTALMYCKWLYEKTKDIKPARIRGGQFLLISDGIRFVHQGILVCRAVPCPSAQWAKLSNP